MLPIDFPHQPPKGFSYYVKEHKTNIIGIWIRNHSGFSYTNDPIVSIWGFYNTKKQCYIAPINHKRPGKTIDVHATSAYSAMPLLKLALDEETAPTAPVMISSSAKEITSMTTTPLNKEFSAFCAQKDAQNAIQINITKYCFELCDALVSNYISESLRRHEFLMPSSDKQEYHQACIDDLKDGRCGYNFTVDTGRKYHKIMMNANGSRSVHAFVDRKTGDVYKPASVKAPAKGVRFNMLIITERETMMEHADWAGGYLYRNASYKG